MSASPSSDDNPMSEVVKGDEPAQDNDAAAQPKRVPRKRRRTVISCTECHRRKQKCDRKLPCTNCISRNKEAACRYETGAPTAKEHRRQSSNTGVHEAERAPVDSIPTKVANFGYSRTGASTLGFLQKIEGAESGLSLSGLNSDASHGESFNTRERYKSLIRQLPARTYIDKLVNLYFENFNWQYYGLDRDVYEKQLAEWYRLPFNLLTSGGPQALPPDLRAFPAMLFQTLASALLVLPVGSDSTFDSLKYAGGMTFEDLAMDYSESGVAILSLLGKRQMSVTTVLAGFLRAAFLKYTALVTEAWHAIGAAIRDAQEIGIHRDSLDPKAKSDDAEAILENQWEIERRRRIWMILVGWDVHTGVVLGRPISTSAGMAQITLPIDAPIPRDRSKTPVRPRSEDDPPTPLTRALWAYHIMVPLRAIVELEKEGAWPKNFSKVDALHQQLLDLESQTPPYFRLENPDTRFDYHPDCYWLPAVRATLPQLMSFNFMALHRPYIFTRPKSRTAALRASLNMLHAQRLHFQSLKPQQYKTFSLFFGTFDAIVLMASIYILFPKEHIELVQNALQHFQWAVERFEAMSERNALAKAALGVLHAIFLCLKKSLGISPQAIKAMLSSPVPPVTSTALSPFPFPFAESPPSTFPSLSVKTDTPDALSPSPHSGTGSGSSTTGTVFTDDLFPESNTLSSDSGGFLPSSFDWASLAPIYATSDLVYNDLGLGLRDDNAAILPSSAWGLDMPGLLGSENAGIVQQQAPEQQQQPQQGMVPFQFEGDFGNDSVWNVLNHYTPF